MDWLARERARAERRRVEVGILKMLMVLGLAWKSPRWGFSTGEYCCQGREAIYEGRSWIDDWDGTSLKASGTDFGGI
jgi:hypothetical protein